MKLSLIAIGTHMPAWVTEGFHTYADRLPREFKLTLVEIAARKRLKKTNLSQLLAQESEQLLAAVPKGDLLVTLDRTGHALDTPKLAQQLTTWRDDHQNVSFIVGGPEGLSPSCIQQAQTLWSLSKLTLPHPLVRVLIAEQIYRAWSIMIGHPYHR